ncbi:hypothetical protein STEG23_019159, partial [Scotinomys teguina]
VEVLEDIEKPLASINLKTNLKMTVCNIKNLCYHPAEFELDDLGEQKKEPVHTVLHHPGSNITLILAYGVYLIALNK